MFVALGLTKVDEVVSWLMPFFLDALGIKESLLLQ
jgi:hypothetical protein